jgi:IS30 family transposase
MVRIRTIYRELKRNSRKNIRNGKLEYSSYFANLKYLKRKERKTKLSSDIRLRYFVNKKLKSHWSPWQIEWYLKYHNKNLQVITHETIYRYIYSHWEIRNEFTPCLRRKHKSRVKQGSRKPRIDPAVMIINRPEIINNRGEFGHWECDLMMFNKGVKCNLITLTERLSRFTIAIKNENKQAKATAFAIVHRLYAIRKYVKSVTFDQGSEFKEYSIIKTCLDTKIYFCNVASPHEKGGLENRNGVIRTIYPRNYDIISTNQREIDKVTKSINERPMVCLNYQIPANLFNYFTGLNDAPGSN